MQNIKLILVVTAASLCQIFAISLALGMISCHQEKVVKTPVRVEIKINQQSDKSHL